MALLNCAIFDISYLASIVVNLIIGCYAFDVNIVNEPLLTARLLIGYISVVTVISCWLFSSWRMFSKKSIHKVTSCVLFYLLVIIVFHAVAVLYGAPLRERFSETFHFACLLATTTVLPCCAVLGPKKDNWRRVFIYNSYAAGRESSVYITTLSSIIGGWIGAFPIPLDWDRPWQVWPRSCLIGNIVGYLIGLALSTIHLSWQHHKASKMKSK